jgi:hypothetical protein
MRNVVSIMNKIRRYLTDDLLLPKYRNERHIKLSHTTGHCYVATEALHHLLTPKQKEKFKPTYLKINEITHWFLRGVSIEGENVILTILDPTADQFTGQLPYELGKSAGFLTKTPSKRALTLLSRITNGNKRSNRHSNNIR